SADSPRRVLSTRRRPRRTTSTKTREVGQILNTVVARTGSVGISVLDTRAAPRNVEGVRLCSDGGLIVRTPKRRRAGAATGNVGTSLPTLFPVFSVRVRTTASSGGAGDEPVRDRQDTTGSRD